MGQATDIGINRTGTAMAPNQSADMARVAETSIPSSGADGHAMDRLRQDYIHDAPPIGSTPPPLSLKGAAAAGAQIMQGKRPSVFIDKLGERLAFERTGTRLYEAVLAKFDALGTWNRGPSRDELVAFHDEEKKHFELVREAVIAQGGDPTVMTPSADMAGVTSQGVLQVITDPRTSLTQALQALLVAELADNDGWQMLIHLAELLGQDDLVRRFRAALAEEDKHLQAVRRWLSVEMEQDVQGGVQAKRPTH